MHVFNSMTCEHVVQGHFNEIITDSISAQFEAERMY